MANLEYAIEVWEIYLDQGNYGTLHYLFHWYDLGCSPEEYRPFMCAYDYDY